MNRRILMIMSIFSLGLSLLSAAFPASLRYSAMGSSGIALSDSQESFKVNPAALFRTETTQFSLNTRYADTYHHPDSGDTDILPFLNEPETRFDMTFATRYSALSVALDFTLQEREYNASDQSISYTGYNNSQIQFNLAYGNDTLSIGAYARGGSTLYRPDITIYEDGALYDYLTQVFFARYYPAGAQQLFTTGLGLLVTYPYVSFGFLTDSLFGYDSETNEISLDVQALLDETSLGFAFSTEQFDSDVQLSRFVFASAFDLTDIGDISNRALRFGFELKTQFLRDLYFALQGGYRETRPSPDPLFGFDWDGTVSLGLSARFYDVQIDTAFQVPALWFSQEGLDEEMTLSMSLRYIF